MTFEETAAHSGKKIHRGWIVLTTTALFYATLSGLMVNCIGIIFAGIIEDKGFKASELSIYHSVRSVFSVFAVRPLINMFDNSKHANVYMAVTGVIAMLAFALMPLYTRVWHWYISSLMVSISAASMAYVVAVVINNWFKKNQGMITGFTFMGSGISAALFGPICSGIIEKHGWQMACYTVAGISVVTWILPCLFFMVRSPEDIGELPYGIDSNGAEMKEQKEARHQSVLPENAWPMLALGIALPSAVAMISNQLPTFATSTGLSLSVGAAITSFSMIGNMAFKPILGMASDKIGALNATRVLMSIAGVGILCIMCAQHSPYIIYAGAVFYGAIFACVVTAPSLICKEVYGDELYKGRLSRTQPICTAISAVTSFGYPELYEIMGTWTPVFGICAFLCLLTVAALTVADVRWKKSAAV